MNLLKGKKLQKTYEDFLFNQQRIYEDSFNPESVRKTYPDPKWTHGAKAFTIILEYPKEVTEILSAFAKKIAGAVPSIYYRTEELHTTIADCIASENKRVLDIIVNATYKALKETGSPRMRLGKWIFNQETMVVTGIPDANFIQLVSAVVDCAHEKRVELRKPWGSHITTNRMTKETTDLRELRNLIKSAPKIGVVEPVAVVIAYAEVNKKGITIKPYKRFCLH